MSQSMQPTLIIGDKVLAFRFWPRGWIKKGDIVIIKPVENVEGLQFDCDQDVPWIKRVVATSGDRVSIGTSRTQKNDLEVPIKVSVPQKHFYVNGDANIVRKIPTQIGFVPSLNFLGLVVLRFSNCDKHRNIEFLFRNKSALISNLDAER